MDSRENSGLYFVWICIVFFFGLRNELKKFFDLSTSFLQMQGLLAGPKNNAVRFYVWEVNSQ